MSYANEATEEQQVRVTKVFEELNSSNIEIFDTLYAKDVKFIDPIGEHNGRDILKEYFKELYQNVKSIKFHYDDIISNGSDHVFVWKMTLVATSLNSGNPVIVDGTSVIKFNKENLVYYHRDYFDMGEFIYEKIPFLGWVLSKIKSKMRND